MTGVWCVAPSPGMAVASDGTVTLWDWWLLDGDTVVTHGQGNGAQLLQALPAQAPVNWVLWPDAVSWHRVHWPQVSKRQTAAVLRGLLEDRLLGDPTQSHLALGPAEADAQRWALATPNAPLAQHVPWLQANGHELSAIVPLWAPPSFANGATEPIWQIDVRDGTALLAVWWPERMLTWQLPADHLATCRALLPSPLPRGEASPEAMRPLEQAWGPAGEPWQAQVTPWSTWLHRATQSGWNAAQGTWQSQTPWQRRLRETLTQFATGPQGQAWRWGLAGLAALQLIGLQTVTWLGEREVAFWKAQQVTMLKQAVPDTPVVLNPERQLQRALDVAQANGPRPASPADLTAVLGALHAIWPADVSIQSLSYEDSTRFRLLVNGANPSLKTQAQRELQALGWRLSGSATEWLGERP